MTVTGLAHTGLREQSGVRTHYFQVAMAEGIHPHLILEERGGCGTPPALFAASPSPRVYCVSMGNTEQSRPARNSW